MATKKNSSRQGGMQSILVGICIAAVMLAGFYLFGYTPANKKIESARLQLEAKERALQTVRTQAPLLKPMSEKVKWLEQQLETCRTKIASKGEVASLIRSIEGEAQRIGLKIINMYTKTEMPVVNSSEDQDDMPVQQPAYAKVTLDSMMQADYYKLEGFLGTLQNLESFIVIESIDVATIEEAGSELAIGLKMSLYSKKGVDNNFVAKK
jgi:Tfp pilus assembly protein PilO